MYGRMLAGTSTVSSTHQPALATSAPTAAALSSSRRRTVVGLATRKATASPGRIRNACSCLVRNAKPHATPASAIHAVRHRLPPVVGSNSSARSTQCTHAISSSTNRASGLLKRNIRHATGVVASAAPARRPVRWPNWRRTVAYSSQTASTPMMACGTRIDQLESPKSLTASAMGQMAAGGLSTVMELPASDEPHRNDHQLVEPACAAAE